jgi:hypothetical protein
MKFGIDKFLGIWVSDDLLRLEIVKVDETSAVVSLYTQGGIPITRPFFENTPTVDMPARYDDYYGEFSVVLWEETKGFELHLQYEERYALDQFKRESLVPSLTRHGQDVFLDQYYQLFGTLKHFTKTGAVQ